MTFEQSLWAIEAELRALPERALRSINVDVPAAAVQGIGVARRVRGLRPRLVEACGEERVAPTDRLELVSDALLCAHARHLVSECGSDLSTLSAHVHARRRLLQAQVDTLVARRLLPARVTAKLVGTHGHQNASFDVVQLASVLRSRWDEVSHAVGVTLAELDAAEGAAHELAVAAARREHPLPSDAAALRTRAFTLFFATYEELRRVVHYVQWYEGDGDRIVPPLWSGRPRKGAAKKSKAEDATVIEPYPFTGCSGVDRVMTDTARGSTRGSRCDRLDA